MPRKKKVVKDEPVVVYMELEDERCRPYKKHDSDAGYDLRAYIPHKITLYPGQWKLIPSGVRIALPHGYEAQVRPRSGLALKYGISLMNAPGTIDADYRGDVGCILVNFGNKPFVIHPFDRIAQLVIKKVPVVDIKLVDRVPDSPRGTDGFGSTGISASEEVVVKSSVKGDNIDGEKEKEEVSED